MQSKHPLNILRNLPKAVAKRISSISADEGVFNGDAPPPPQPPPTPTPPPPLYNDALHASGHAVNIEYVETEEKQSKHQRKRDIIWFNPPFSKSVSTNVGAAFLRLITKYFPKTSILHTIFNRNSVKVSYCCLPSMASVTYSHNRKQMTKPAEQKACNCRSPPSCPLRGDCQAEAIVYEAVVTTQHDERGYFGSNTPRSSFAWQTTKPLCALLRTGIAQSYRSMSGD